MSEELIYYVNSFYKQISGMQIFVKTNKKKGKNIYKINNTNSHLLNYKDAVN